MSCFFSVLFKFLTILIYSQNCIIFIKYYFDCVFLALIKLFFFILSSLTTL